MCVRVVGGVVVLKCDIFEGKENTVTQCYKELRHSLNNALKSNKT